MPNNVPPKPRLTKELRPGEKSANKKPKKLTRKLSSYGIISDKEKDLYQPQRPGGTRRIVPPPVKPGSPRIVPQPVKPKPGKGPINPDFDMGPNPPKGNMGPNPPKLDMRPRPVVDRIQANRVDDKLIRSMPITVRQLKAIKKSYGIK